MLIGVRVKPGAADAAAVVFDRPGVGMRIRRPAADGQLLPGAITAPIPRAAPRRAVAVFFLRVDRIAQPVINIRFPPRAHDDTLTSQRGQRRQRQPVQHVPKATHLAAHASRKTPGLCTN
jgi:hypothetical protein